MRKKTVKRFACFLALILTGLNAFTLFASANWYDDVSGGTYIEITSDNFVADTLCGVKSLYNKTGVQPQCNELVMRFYSEAFGLEVMAISNTLQYQGPVMVSDGYGFLKTEAPKTGDVVYAPSVFRDGNGDHWAIVKNYADGKITLFEQNVVWNGKAGINRTLIFPSDNYYVFTPISRAGYSAPALAEPQAAQTTVASTSPETTTSATTLAHTVTTMTTIAPKTFTSTTKEDEKESPSDSVTQPATVSPSTFPAPVETLSNETDSPSALSETQSVPISEENVSDITSSVPEETLFPVTETGYLYTEPETAVPPTSRNETTRAEEDNTQKHIRIAFIAALSVVAALIAGVSVFLVKRK
ncbi:MAG: hypothetical protein K6F64_06585 [Clostridia bacterium]|nr:hypothetical protein [Clostridia bacterium]